MTGARAPGLPGHLLVDEAARPGGKPRKAAAAVIKAARTRAYVRLSRAYVRLSRAYPTLYHALYEEELGRTT